MKESKPVVATIRLETDMNEWLLQWAEAHCTPFRGSDNNRSEAMRMALQLAKLVDETPEFREIINKDFAGDYRLFVKRAIEDYHKAYEEDMLGEQYESLDDHFYPHKL